MTEPAITPEAGPVCGFCGATSAPGDKFCEACGKQLDAAAEAAPAGPPAETTLEVPVVASAPVEGACPQCGAGPEQRDADGYCGNCGIRLPRERDHVEIAPAAGSGPAALVDVAVVSDRGVRHHRNEDAGGIAIAGAPQPAVLAVVCDGVSSSVDPDKASAAAVAATITAVSEAIGAGPVAAADLQPLLSHAVERALAAVVALAAPGAAAQAAPACTIVASVIVHGTVGIAWLGDSRAYWVGSEGAAVPLTTDDSWASEAIADGVPPERAYRLPQAHAITAWLGVEAPLPQPHFTAVPGDLVATGGALMICSDGLWNYAPDDGQMGDLVREQALAGIAAGDPSALGLARRLVGWAVDAGGSDNITVAVVPVAAVAATAGTAEETMQS